MKDYIRALVILAGTIGLGYGFVSLMSEFTWMVHNMDMIVWALLYLGGCLTASTYLLIKKLKA